MSVAKTGYLQVWLAEQGLLGPAGYQAIPVSFTTAGITPGANNLYSAATTKFKVTTEIKLSESNAAFVIIQAKVESKKTLEIKVGLKGALNALPTAENPGAAAGLVTYDFILPAGQYFEILTTGVEGEPTGSFVAL